MFDEYVWVLKDDLDYYFAGMSLDAVDQAVSRGGAYIFPTKEEAFDFAKYLNKWQGDYKVFRTKVTYTGGP